MAFERVARWAARPVVALPPASGLVAGAAPGCALLTDEDYCRFVRSHAWYVQRDLWRAASAELLACDVDGVLSVVGRGSRLELARNALRAGWLVYPSVGELASALAVGRCRFVGVS